MKTLKFRLFATIITLAAVTYISIPANAQRRSSQREKTNREAVSRKSSGKNIEKKSTFKNYDKADRNKVNSGLNAHRNTTTAARTQKSNSGGDHKSSNSGTNRNKTTSVFNNRQNKTGLSTKPAQHSTRTTEASREKQEFVKGTAATGRNHQGDLAMHRQNTSQRVGSFTDDGRKNTGRTVNTGRDFYRADKNDIRYTPNKNYRGGRNYWSEHERPRDMNYNNKDRAYYLHYNSSANKHWNRNWERYRWNYNSWFDYYHGYNPTAFVYYKYYYHHPIYGHVIRRFDFQPLVLLHNHQNYYCFDGHFFRYRPGIGYILVDLPFGFTIEYLPSAYAERVYINGYLYFRVDNLFFESSAYGFSLIHYPDRYYAWDDSFCRQGYMFDGMYY